MKKIITAYKHFLSLFFLFGIIVLLQAQQPVNQEIVNTSLKNIHLDSVLDVYVFQNVYFDADSNNLREADIATLEQILFFFKTYPELKLEIKGHTDNKEVQSLSISRSQTVFQWFINQGIEKQRLIYKSMGSIYPAVSKNTFKYSQLNRRVEFNVIK